MNAAVGDTLFDDARRRWTLARLVKSGGAGSVFLLQGSSTLVAKLYHPHVDLSTYARKLEAMLRLSPDLPEIVDGAHRTVQVAWPTSRLHDRHGRFVGFLMPAVDVQATSELEIVLQEKQARAAGLPTGLGAKMTLAANLAAVVAALHAQHHYIVDLKPVNLRFHRQSLYMALLDCDGFSIQGQGERFPAPQFTPDYLAPEFHRAGITPDGEQAQDRFALAVVIFQLLNFGIHPFTGRPSAANVPTDIPGRIAGHWYAYGVGGNAGIAPSPVSGHVRMPSDVRALFDRAFQSRGFGRPSPAEWQALLESYARRSTQRMIVCTQDAAHQHYAGFACAQCDRALLLRKARAAQPTRTATPVRTRHVPRRRAPATQVPGTLPHAPRPWRHPPPPRPAAHRVLSAIWNALPARVAGAFLGLCIFGVMQLVEWIDNFGSPPASPPVVAYRYTPPPPAPEPPDYTPPLDALVGDVAWIGGFAHLAGEYNSNLSAITKSLQARAQPWPPTSRETLRAYQALLDTDVTRAELRASLELLLRADQRASEVAFEIGAMALEDGGRDAATRGFLHAIAVAPASPAGWYGLAAAKSPQVQDMYGALSVAEALVTRDDAEAAAMRSRISAAMRGVQVGGPDSLRFDIVAARARVRVAQWRGLRAPAEVEALARQALPQ